MKHAILISLAVVALCLDLFSEAPTSSSKDYPSGPITIIVPFASGGESDTTARIFERAIEKHQLLRQPIVIDNQKGAGGTIGSRKAKDASPDGYTLLLLHDAILTAKYSGKVSYGPEAFEPIAATGVNNLLIAVAESSPYRTLQDLLNASKEKTITFGVNRGAPTHFVGMQLQSLVPGSKFSFPQSGGGADRYRDLQGEHIAVTAFSVSEFLQYRSGGLRALVLCANEKHEALPNVPTAKDLNLDIVSSNMQMWWAPKGTPQRRLKILTDVIEKAMTTPEIREHMKKRFIRPVFLRDEALRDRIQQRAKQIATVSPAKTTGLPDVPVIVAILIAACLVGLAFQNAPTQTLVLGWTVLYVVILSQSWLGFRWATLAFVPIQGLSIQPRRESILPLLCLATLLGFGVHFVCTHLVSVSLP